MIGSIFCFGKAIHECFFKIVLFKKRDLEIMPVLKKDLLSFLKKAYFHKDDLVRF